MRMPSRDELVTLGMAHGIRLDPAWLETLHRLVASQLNAYDRLEVLSAETRDRPIRRDPGGPPVADTNRLGAWYWRCHLTTVDHGPLAGRTVALKDNVLVAGIPLSCGSRLLEGYVADEDATIVSRILDAGGVIAGKVVCENLGMTGGSHTSHTGPVRNPYDPMRTSGGSSSGSAALVAVGDVDMSIGGDQGGSIRIPSAFCGVYGLKPTYGLVPYTGIVPMELGLDHAGPIARTVRDLALLLDAIAGPDGIDPRQRGVARPAARFVDAVDASARGVRVGILREGFARPGLSEPNVDAAAESAARLTERLGCVVREVSVPEHMDGEAIFNGIFAEGAYEVLFSAHALGSGWRGRYPLSLLEAYRQGLRARPHELSEMATFNLLVGAYLTEAYGGRYYAMAQNLAPRLTAAYDRSLAEVDVLAMPTVPMKAPLLPPSTATLEERIAAGATMAANTCPFDVTGHPAMSVPCAMRGGLPVGLMIVARRGEDATLIRLAAAFEREVFSPPPP